jgi:hypothetical protein
VYWSSSCENIIRAGTEQVHKTGLQWARRTNSVQPKSRLSFHQLVYMFHKPLSGFRRNLVHNICIEICWKEFVLGRAGSHWFTTWNSEQLYQLSQTRLIGKKSPYITLYAGLLKFNKSYFRELVGVVYLISAETCCDLRGIKWQQAGENYIMRSFIICTL